MIDWKKIGINDGDIACMMGLDPRRTLYDLWIEKMTGVSKNSNGYMKNKIADGKEKAAIIFDMLEEYKPFKTTMAIPEFNFCKAFIDGYNEELNEIVCYRMSGKENHALAKMDTVEKQYEMKIQYLLWITGANKCKYVSYYDSEIYVITVLPQAVIINKIREKIIEFNNSIVNNIAPPLSVKDSMEITDNDFIERIKKYKKNILEIKNIQKTMEPFLTKIADAEKDFKNRMNHPIMTFENFKIQRIDKKGTIDWKKAAKMSEDEAEKYRKKNSISYKITVK